MFLNPESILHNIGIFRSGMKVGDFGCGAGYFTIALSRVIGEDGEVTAVDILDSALETVKRKAAQMNMANIKTAMADLEKLGSTGLPEGSLDAVLLATILFQSEKKEEILKESRRVIIPGGRLIIIDWEPQAAMGPAGHKVSKEDARALAENSGFTFEKEFAVDPYHYGLLFRV